MCEKTITNGRVFESLHNHKYFSLSDCYFVKRFLYCELCVQRYININT